MRVKDFKSYSMHTSKVMKGSDVNLHYAWIELAAVKAFRCTTDPHYLEGRATSTMVCETISRTANVEF